MNSIPYSALKRVPLPPMEGEELHELTTATEQSSFSADEEGKYLPLNRVVHREGCARVALRAGVKTTLTAVVIFAGSGFLEPSFQTGRKVNKEVSYILAIAGWVAYTVAACFAMFSFVDAIFETRRISRPISSSCAAYSKRLVKLIVSLCSALIAIFPAAWAAYKYNENSWFPRIVFPVALVLSDMWSPAHSTHSSLGRGNRLTQHCSKKCSHPLLKETNEFREGLIAHIDGQNQILRSTWDSGDGGREVSQSRVEFDPGSASSLLDQYYAKTYHLKGEDNFSRFSKYFSHPIGMSRAIRLRPLAVGVGRFLGLTQIALAGCLGADGIHKMGGSLIEEIAGGIGISAIITYYMGGHASAAATDTFDTVTSILVGDYTPSLAAQLRWKTTWALRTLLGTASMLSFGADLTFYDDIIGDRAGFATIPLKTAIAVGSACFTGHVCMTAVERMVETSVVLLGEDYEHEPIFDSANLRHYREAVSIASPKELLTHASTLDEHDLLRKLLDPKHLYSIRTYLNTFPDEVV